MVGICQRCRSNGELHIHHRDGNHDNDVPENRQPLCPSCHSLAHVDLRIEDTGRPGSKPLSGRVYDMPHLSWAEIKEQYNLCFPRA